MRRAYAAGPEKRAASRDGLARIRERVLAEAPGAAVFADQAYRENDLAMDFREDVAPLLPGSAERIKAIFEEEGAVARISSIHVNGWFGDWDKLRMSRRFAAERIGMDLGAERTRMVDCGDSPNDAPMFGFFPNACGVANMRAFEGRMEAEPGWITEGCGGAGFVEIADMLLKARGAGDNIDMQAGKPA